MRKGWLFSRLVSVTPEIIKLGIQSTEIVMVSISGSMAYVVVFRARRSPHPCC